MQGTNLILAVGFNEEGQQTGMILCKSSDAKDAVKTILKRYPLSLEFGIYDVIVASSAIIGIAREDIDNIPQLLGNTIGRKVS